MTFNPPDEDIRSCHSMPGVVDGNSASTHFPNTNSNNLNRGQQSFSPRRNTYRRTTPTSSSPTSSLSSSRGSRFSPRGSSYAKRRWPSNLTSPDSQSVEPNGCFGRDLRSDQRRTSDREKMPSEFDQSSEAATRGSESHVANMDDRVDHTSGPATLNILVSGTSDANSNISSVVVKDTSAGSSVDGLVSSYSTDSEDLDDSSSSGAATSLSPASSTSLGSPGARDVSEPVPSLVFYGKNSPTSKNLTLMEERQRGKENVNRIKTSDLSRDDLIIESALVDKKQGTYENTDTGSFSLESSTSECDNTPTGELDENDNCDKPLAHILSQVNSPTSSSGLDNRKYRSKKSSREDPRSAPSTQVSSTATNRDTIKKTLPEDGITSTTDQTPSRDADTVTGQNSSPEARLTSSGDNQQVQLSSRVNSAADCSSNTQVQFEGDQIHTETSKPSGDNTALGHVDQASESRPEVCGTVTGVETEALSSPDSLSIDTSSVVLKRPRSYPQVSQKTLFTPIPPPSPEQAGLYQPGESKSVEAPVVHVPTTLALTGFTSHSSRACTAATTTTMSSTSGPHGTSLPEIAASTSGKRMKRPQKMAQSNLPVARVNPQANPNVTAPGTTNSVASNGLGGPQPAGDPMNKPPQYPYYPQHQVSQQQQFYPTPQLYPIPPGVYMHDPMGGNTGYFAPGPLPVVFLSEPPGYCEQNYYQDAGPLGYQPYVPQSGPRMPPPMCFPPDHQHAFTAPYRPTSEAGSTGGSHRSFKGASSTLESSDSSNLDKASNHSPAISSSSPSPKRSTDQNQASSSQSEHKPSPRNTPSNVKKKHHKQPLLPDPLIPKLSERAPQPQAAQPDAASHTMDIQPEMYQNVQPQHQYFQANSCQPPGHHHQMLQPQQAFFLQQMAAAANGANAPVFQGNYMEPMGSSGPGFSHHPSMNGVLITSPPPVPTLHLHGGGLPGERLATTPASNSASSSTASPAPDNLSTTVSFVTDSTGLVIYGPQPPAAHSPAPLCLPIMSPDTTTSTAGPNTAPLSNNSGMECHNPQQHHQVAPTQDGEDLTGVPSMPQAPGLDPEDPNSQQQQHQVPVAGGLLYIPDGSGTGYMAVEVSALQAAQMEAPGGYHVLSAPQDIPYRPQDGQQAHTLADSANNRPATVRMLSSNGPPMPMPMQVPPGHMVQQIVDEHGILTHVILSPQPPGPAGPLSGGPASGSQYYTSYGSPHYGPPAPGPAGYPPHHHSAPPPHVHGGMGPHHGGGGGGGGPHMPSNAAPGCSNHGPGQPQAEYGASPPLNSTDDRTLRTRNRVRKKLQQRRINSNDGGYYPNNHPGPGPRSMGGPRRNRGGAGQGGPGGPVNGDLNSMHIEASVAHTQCSQPPENGPVDMEEENSMIVQCLSTMPPPKVTGVEARISQILLSPPDCDGLDLDLSDLKFELFLNKGRDDNYDLVFCGKTTELTLEDLMPYTEYNLKCCAVLGEELRGALSESVGFRTLQCEPEPPLPPKMVQKTKTSLALRWNAACDNGSKITTYLLEWDQGTGAENNFKEIYAGFQRQHKLVRLNASTKYLFRLAAINAFGKSQYSDVVGFHTSGLPPSQPDPPELDQTYVSALGIKWKKAAGGDDFLLQMEDESTGHGFMPVYNGQNQYFKVTDLKRNTAYKFRLSVKNDAGASQWSQTVCFSTRPDRPHAPSKPQLKGKINPYSFRITWDPPNDSGGTEITKFIVELDDGQGYDIVYEGSEREHTFDHLRPGHTYRVRVACCSLGGRSDFSDCCVATTLPVIPGHCNAPKLHGKPKATSLHLKWGYPDYDGGAQVTSFAVQMISSDNSTKEVFKGHDRACIVGGLLPGRSYLFQVQAFNRAGAGPWSEALEVVSGAGVPEPPRVPQVTCRSPHSALVAWDEPFNNGALVSEYRLEWQQRSDAAEFTQLYVGPNQSFDVKGLTPATMYTFRVQAINSAGAGQFSAPAQFQTPASSPGPIASIKVVPEATQARLSWRQPNTNGSDITSYNIDVSDRNTPLSVDPVTEYLLEGLQPETSYKIRVQAVNSIGVGPYSNSVKVTTRALPPAPPRLDCVMLAPTSIKLKWGEGRHSDLLTYTLEMEKEDGSFQPVYTGPAHTHKVTRLTELTTYEFRIFASNEAGGGPYSDTYSFTTTKAPPPPLKAPRVSNVSQHACTVEWLSGKPQGADSTAYILQLLCLNGRDTEYKQVYRGPNTSFQLEDLTAHTEYQARVAAVRLASDQSGDIVGVFSPGVVFSLAPSEPSGHHSSSLAGSAGSSSSSPEERRPWTDQQWAAVILLGFLLVAVVSAYACHILVTYMGGDSSNQFSSSGGSTPPSSSGHSRGGSHHGGRGFS